MVSIISSEHLFLYCISQADRLRTPLLQQAGLLLDSTWRLITCLGLLPGTVEFPCTVPNPVVLHSSYSLSLGFHPSSLSNFKHLHFVLISPSIIYHSASHSRHKIIIGISCIGFFADFPHHRSLGFYHLHRFQPHLGDFFLAFTLFTVSQGWTILGLYHPMVWTPSPASCRKKA